METLRTKLYDILGLEKAPDGEDDMLLTRDEDGDIIEGVSFKEELDEIEALLLSEIKKQNDIIRTGCYDKCLSIIKNCQSTIHDEPNTSYGLAENERIYAFIANQK